MGRDRINCCPHCGASLYAGVWLTRAETRIYQLVELSGKAGLCPEAYGLDRKLVKQHVHNINNKFLGTDLRIKARDGSWKFELLD